MPIYAYLCFWCRKYANDSVEEHRPSVKKQKERRGRQRSIPNSIDLLREGNDQLVYAEG